MGFLVCFMFDLFCPRLDVLCVTKPCLFSEVAHTMQKNDRSGDDTQHDSVSKNKIPFSLHS